MYNLDYAIISTKKKEGWILIIIWVFLMMIFGTWFFGGTIRKLGMDATVEADRVTIDVSYGEDSDTYRPTYYYSVNGKGYKYTPLAYTNVGVEDMKDKTLYYQSSDPSKAVAEYQTIIYPVFKIVSGLFCILLFFGVKNLVEAKTLKKKFGHLEMYGTLIKDLPCRMIDTNVRVNEVPVFRLEVDYTLPSGEIVTFKEKKRGYFEEMEANVKLDLLIDMNNPSVYYLDFNIG